MAAAVCCGREDIELLPSAPNPGSGGGTGGTPDDGTAPEAMTSEGDASVDETGSPDALRDFAEAGDGAPADHTCAIAGQSCQSKAECCTGECPLAKDGGPGKCSLQ